MEEQITAMRRELEGMRSRLAQAADEMRRAVAQAEKARTYDLVPVRSMALIPVPRRRRRGPDGPPAPPELLTQTTGKVVAWM